MQADEDSKSPWAFKVIRSIILWIYDHLLYHIHQEGLAVVILVLVQLYCRRVWYDRMSFLKQHRVDHVKGPNLSAAPEVIDWCAWASNIDMSK